MINPPLNRDRGAYIRVLQHRAPVQPVRVCPCCNGFGKLVSKCEECGNTGLVKVVKDA